VVIQENTAQAFGSGTLPVFGTPALIALLEQAAVDALAHSLAPAQTSVGVRVDVRHLAATPLGLTVHAQATLLAVDGCRLTFAVTAFDDAEQVAEGAHERVIIDEQRFLARTQQKQT
jgi:predicted thioesterase